jgi:aminobenzoyl-glutamate transport protein
LPQPATLFALMAALVIAASAVAERLDLEVIHPATGQPVRPVSLASVAGLHRILTEMVANFTGFAPLGMVLVVMLGIGVAEGSGLISAALKLLVLSAPSRLLTFAVVFAGVMSNTAGDVGHVLLPPLAAGAFLAVGRHPLAGVAAAFAGVSGGYSANMLLGPVDPLLAGISEEAARIIDGAYTVNPACNYYFMATSAPILALTGTFVTERLVEPRLGPYRGPRPGEAIARLTPAERRGLRAAFAAAALITGVLLIGTLRRRGSSATRRRAACSPRRSCRGSWPSSSSPLSSSDSPSAPPPAPSGRTGTSCRECGRRWRRFASTSSSSSSPRSSSPTSDGRLSD